MMDEQPLGILNTTEYQCHLKSCKNLNVASEKPLQPKLWILQNCIKTPSPLIVLIATGEIYTMCGFENTTSSQVGIDQLRC